MKLTIEAKKTTIHKLIFILESRYTDTLINECYKKALLKEQQDALVDDKLSSMIDEAIKDILWA